MGQIEIKANSQAALVDLIDALEAQFPGAVILGPVGAFFKAVQLSCAAPIVMKMPVGSNVLTVELTLPPK